MTFEEYVNQKDAKKLGVGSIEIDDSWELTHSIKKSEVETWDYYSVTIDNIDYQYIRKVTPVNSRLLFTVDEDGNPKSMSVFKVRKDD